LLFLLLECRRSDQRRLLLWLVCQIGESFTPVVSVHLLLLLCQLKEGKKITLLPGRAVK
jgi:hypothetical protein